MVMVIIQLLGWWYGRGWHQTVNDMNRRLDGVMHVFSVPILLRTLFAPWRRIISYPGGSFDAHLRAYADNAVSRIIGLTVRASVLLTAAVLLVMVGVGSGLIILLWPLLPLSVPVFVVMAVISL